jgi:hypothetical protein
MADPKGTRPPPPRWPADPAPPAAKPTAAPKTPEKRDGPGRIVHDSRGNAIWDWVKETGRFCVESTSAMLKRLEVPGLKMEGEKDDELRVESEHEEGGGYDPYNQRKAPPKTKAPRK